MATQYWQAPSGAYYQTETGDTGTGGWTSITLAAYNAGLAAAQAAITANIAAGAAASCAARKAAYQWYVDAGAPPAIAATMTNFVVGSC